MIRTRHRRVNYGNVSQLHFVSRLRGSTRVPPHPFEDESIRFLRRLPKETVRLAVEHFELGLRNSSRQRFGLYDMIATPAIVVADQHQRRTFYIAETVGRLPGVPGDTEVDVFG
jgi:hypothetical protein